jgi:endonuclease YncB( thermonuclease family)
MLRSIIHAVGFVALISAAALGVAQQADSACGDDTLGEVTVAAVLDGRTIMTTDHREVRLAGIEAPGPKAALDALIAGKTVALMTAGRGEDRYGRVVAYIYRQDALIQADLLRAGAAYVAARPGPRPCADLLFAAERAARQPPRGLWADPDLRPKSAANRDEILRLKGHFALVEGKVLSVRDRGATIYLNFGRVYTRGFSVAVPRRLVPRLAVAPKRLQDKHILVRGVIEARGGPLIETERPEQIELIE